MATPTSVKTVTFKLPRDPASSERSAPFRLTSPPPSTSSAPQMRSPTMPTTLATPTSVTSPTFGKKATAQQKPPSPFSRSSPSDSDLAARLARAKAAHHSASLVVEDVESETPPTGLTSTEYRRSSPYNKKHSPQTTRPQSRPSSDMQSVLGQQKSGTGDGGGVVPISLAARDRSPRTDALGASMTSAEVAGVASQLRRRTNAVSHTLIRGLRFDAARLREHLLKVEEEVKLLNRSRHTLELSIQDLRKALSVNQQSLSTQQKKSSRVDKDASVSLLHEEAQILSRAKRSVEQQLQTSKSHLQSLDTNRKSLKSKIGTTSRALEFDTHDFKVYDGPIATRSDAVSRQRHYASACPAPKSRTSGGATETSNIAQQCAQAMGIIVASRTLRAEIKANIVSVHSIKMETHKKISGAIAKNVVDAKAQRRDTLLERGQVRLAQNSALHQKHSEEIALGIALGPVSEKHRSVSESSSRPLSRLRPASAVEERTHFTETTSKLTRQLSATTVRASQMGHSEQRLVQQARESSQSAGLDTATLRIRKISLDNRWMK